MGYLGALALLAGAHTLGAISPGPNFLFVSSTAMNQSRRAGLGAGLGVAAGSITWAGLTLSGLGLVISHLPQLYDAMRLVGAAYLIWLGGKMAWKAGAPMRARRSHNFRRLGQCPQGLACEHDQSKIPGLLCQCLCSTSAGPRAHLGLCSGDGRYIAHLLRLVLRRRLAVIR